MPQVHNLYEMKLHDTLVAEDGFLFTVVLRVPGGWLYRSYDKESKILGSQFVPFDNEFQTDPTKESEAIGEQNKVEF